MKIVGNSLFQKAANSALILNYLRLNESSSRQRMAEELGLQPSSVSYIVNRLIRAGIAEEVREDDPRKKSGSGRKPIALRLSARFGYIIGLDLQVDYYSAVITDVSGRIIRSRRKEFVPGISDFETLLLSSVEELKQELDPQIPILGMGLALPGIVDRDNSLVKDSWTHKLKNASLAPFLDKHFTFPVVLENDANCCAQDILWNQPESRDDSFVYLLSRFHKRNMVPEDLPSVGVGLGLVLNGSLYEGISHEAGEYQSILFSRERRMKWQLALSEEEMDRALYDEDVQREIIKELLGNMIFLLQILNPRGLYIGGDLSRNGSMVREILEWEYPEKWARLQAKGCRLKMVEDGGFDPARGAAACMLSDLYAIPQIGGEHVDRRHWNNLLSNIVEENQ